jgi:uncharacterized protein YeaC (DUF1315 family)
MCENGYTDPCDPRLRLGYLNNLMVLDRPPYTGPELQFSGMHRPVLPPEVYGRGVTMIRKLSRWPDGTCRYDNVVRKECAGEACTMNARFRAEQDARSQIVGTYAMQLNHDDEYCGPCI